MKKKILLGLLIVFIGMQFFRIDKTNEITDKTKDFINITNPSSQVASMLKDACYDCHSNESKYPWYSNIAPVSWWMKSHINNGRKHLNFSTWGDYSKKKQDHKVEENIEMLEKNWMPILTYKLMHAEGRLSEEERESIITFFKSL